MQIAHLIAVFVPFYNIWANLPILEHQTKAKQHRTKADFRPKIAVFEFSTTDQAFYLSTVSTGLSTKILVK